MKSEHNEKSEVINNISEEMKAVYEKYEWAL